MIKPYFLFLLIIGTKWVESADWPKEMFNVSIVTLGDSLTHGMVVGGEGRSRHDVHHHPYSKTLAERFISDHLNVTVLEQGVDGELTDSMIHRLPPILERSASETDQNLLLPPIKFVTILGGTNDLGHRVPADIILNRLLKLHQLVQEHAIRTGHNVYTVAIGIPEVSWAINQEDRIKVNIGLKDYAKRCSKVVSYLDWEEDFLQSIPEHAKYWSVDTVHFSDEGYRYIGNLLYRHMQKFLEEKPEATMHMLEINSPCQ